MAKKNKFTPEEGLKVGHWTLVQHLDSGGNGEVWEVAQERRSKHAMKFLSRIDNVRYERFKSEIYVVSNKFVEGMIPIVESHLPEFSKDDNPWYVMPKALRFDIYLKGKTLLEVAGQFVLLGKTLNNLHLENIYHRDIKPENILFYNGRLCFSDFGLVKYPGKPSVTEEKRDVGAKFTMAPEMRRNASSTNGESVDIYSLAKSLWIAITGEKKGFDGQYIRSSILSIKSYCENLYVDPLEDLLSECTDSSPSERPGAKEFSERLMDWINLNSDFHNRNVAEWTNLQRIIFPHGSPSQAVWADIDSICSILNEIGKRHSLNHMFYPFGGGMDLTGASKAAESGMIVLHTQTHGAEIVKPEKLTYESFHYNPQWNYFRLEVGLVEATGIGNSLGREAGYETLLEIVPGEYVDVVHWDDQKYAGKDLPMTARRVKRYLKGSFVLFSKRSIYNRLTGPYDAYDARHNRMSEIEFKYYIEKLAKTSFEEGVS